MLTAPVAIAAARTAEDQRPGEVQEDRDHPPVEAVRGGTRPDAEEQRRRDLREVGHGHEEGVVRLRGDEQRAGGERDAVAEVAEQGRREEPPEAPTEPRGGKRLQHGCERHERGCYGAAARLDSGAGDQGIEDRREAGDGEAHVAVVVVEVRARVRQVAREPLPMGERDHPIMGALPDVDPAADLGQVEPPWAA